MMMHQLKVQGDSATGPYFVTNLYVSKLLIASAHAVSIIAMLRSLRVSPEIGCYGSIKDLRTEKTGSWSDLLSRGILFDSISN